MEMAREPFFDGGWREKPVKREAPPLGLTPEVGRSISGPAPPCNREACGLLGAWSRGGFDAGEIRLAGV